MIKYCSYNVSKQFENIIAIRNSSLSFWHWLGKQKSMFSIYGAVFQTQNKTKFVFTFYKYFCFKTLFILLLLLTEIIDFFTSFHSLSPPSKSRIYINYISIYCCLVGLCYLIMCNVRCNFLFLCRSLGREILRDFLVNIILIAAGWFYYRLLFVVEFILFVAGVVFVVV